MPRVVYDSQVFTEQQHGGVSRYFLALAEHMGRFGWEPRLALGLHVGAGSLPSGVLPFGPRLRIPLIGHTFRVRRAANTLLMRSYGPRQDGNTVYHPTWYHLPAIQAWGSLPLILTIHDLIPERWPGVTTPEQLQHRRESLRRARSVVCVSQSTLQRLEVYYPWAAGKASVARLGISHLPAAVENAPSDRPYLVHVGKRGHTRILRRCFVPSASYQKGSISSQLAAGPPPNTRRGLWHWPD